MTKRYSIVGIQYQADHETVIVEVDANPEAVVAALKEKTLNVYAAPGATRRSITPLYHSVRIVENKP